MEQAHKYNWQLATSPEFIDKKDVNWLPNDKYHVRPCLKSQWDICVIKQNSTSLNLRTQTWSQLRVWVYTYAIQAW